MNILLGEKQGAMKTEQTDLTSCRDQGKSSGKIVLS